MIPTRTHSPGWPLFENRQASVAARQQAAESTPASCVPGQFDDASEDSDSPVEENHAEENQEENQQNDMSNRKRRPEQLRLPRRKKCKAPAEVIDVTNSDDDDDDEEDQVELSPSTDCASSVRQSPSTVSTPGTKQSSVSSAATEPKAMPPTKTPSVSVIERLAAVTLQNLPPEIKPMPQSDSHAFAYGSQYLGVKRNGPRGTTWNSTIYYKGSNYCLGNFRNEWDAGAIYTWAYVILYGNEVLSKIQAQAGNNQLQRRAQGDYTSTRKKSWAPFPKPIDLSKTSVQKALSVIDPLALPLTLNPILASPESRGLTLRSPYAGVVRRRSNWESSIVFQGIPYILGQFSSEWLAGAIHAWAFIILHGEEAYSELMGEESKRSKDLPKSLKRTDKKSQAGIATSEVAVRIKETDLKHPSSALIPKQNGPRLVPTQPVVIEDENREHPIPNPTNLDIVHGRGGVSIHHNGNKWYRRLIQHYRDIYSKLPKFDKMQLSRNLVNYIRWRGGRFLVAHKDEDKEGSVSFFEAGDKKAAAKTSTCLREGCRSLIEELLPTLPSANQNKISQRHPLNLPRRVAVQDSALGEATGTTDSNAEKDAEKHTAEIAPKPDQMSDKPETTHPKNDDAQVEEENLDIETVRPCKDATKSLPQYMLF